MAIAFDLAIWLGRPARYCKRGKAFAIYSRQVVNFVII